MKTLSRLILLVIAIAIVDPVIAAGDPNEKAIDARQSVMSLQSWYAGTLFAMAKGKIEYDAEKASAAAANLKMVVHADSSGMWPEGTDNSGAYKGKTRALPEGWTKWDPKYGEDLVKATDAMADAAGNGLEALRAKIEALGDACSGCHDANRAEDF